MTTPEPMALIVEFLNDRLVEDEKLAWECVAEKQQYPESTLRYPYPARVARMLHDGRHDPETVLRDVGAKRLIMAQYERTLREDWAEAAGLEYAVQILAYGYRTHEDYQLHAWSPVWQRW